MKVPDTLIANVLLSAAASRDVRHGDSSGGVLTILVRSSEVDLCEDGRRNPILFVVLRRTGQSPLSQNEDITS
jgi:hypothetical protein